MASTTNCKICLYDGKTNAAEYFCEKCRAHMCASCEAKHRVKSSYKHHTVLPFAPILDAGVTCNTHQQELATVWCDTCNIAICMPCDMRKHNKHKTKELKHYLSDWVADVHSLGEKVKLLKHDILFSKTSIDSRIKELQSYLANTEKEIKQHYTKLMEKITTRKDELLSRLKETIESRIQNLQNDMQLENDKIQQLNKWTTGKNNTLAGNVKLELQKIVDHGRNLAAYEPEDAPAYEDLKFIPQSSLEVGRLTEKPDVSMVWERSITRNVGDICFITPTTLLVTHDIDGGASRYARQDESMAFEYQHKILQDHHLRRIALHKNVCYFTCIHHKCKTVHKCRTNTLQLALAGQWRTNVFSDPCSIAVTGSGQVVVSDTSKKEVSIHKSNGDRLVTIGGQAACSNTDIQFLTPFYIATYNDNIYVSDCNQHQVFVFNIQGQLLSKIGKYGSKDGQFNTPCGVCFTETGKLWVADKDNKRVTQFDNEGSFISHVITTEIADIGKPWYLTSIQRDQNMRFLCIFDQSDNNRLKTFQIQ